MQPIPINLPADPAPALSVVNAQDAAITFVRDLSDKNPDVWRFATEEEQEGFAQERDAVAAFAQAYPPLANATEISVARATATDDGRNVAVYVKDSKGLEWLASMHLWLDDAGDWKVVDCSIQPAPDYSV